MKTTLILRDFKSLDDVLKACTDSGIIDDLRLNITKEGINFKEVDRTMVICLDTTIKASYFDEYETDDRIVTLNLPSLRCALKPLDKKDKIIIKIDDTNAHIIQTIDFKSDTMLPLLENKDSDSIPSVDAMKWTSYFTIKTDTFKKIIKNFQDKKIDTLIIELKDDGVYFSWENTELKISKGDDTLLDFQGQKASSRFSVEYLEKIAKFTNPKIFDSVKIYLSQDFPLKAELINDNFRIALIVAPRICSEE